MWENTNIIMEMWYIRYVDKQNYLFRMYSLLLKRLM